jgi:membrane protease subunit HflK
MERVLSHTRKVLVNDKGNNLMVLPLDQIMRGQGGASSNATQDSSSNSLLRLPPASGSNDRASNGSTYNPDTIMDQRRANAQRNDTQREGRE